MNREGATESLAESTLLWRYWKLKAAGEGRVSFLCGGGPWLVAHVPVDGSSTYVHISSTNWICVQKKNASSSCPMLTEIVPLQTLTELTSLHSKYQ